MKPMPTWSKDDAALAALFFLSPSAILPLFVALPGARGPASLFLAS